ncbi:MAG: hypothetical protein Q4D78_01815 [Neisseria zoodegmatis]|uniref:tetratricopeptide repeat protein n=1 Tax=Neisseria zoodegmatis TaxID=326523 RepID=UPI0026EB92A8|nr:hypothetical protein [Neisseria zoodegmatis]MDO5068929.1 hypothetical protein [Neisseria zoodegmatis]
MKKVIYYILICILIFNSSYSYAGNKVFISNDKYIKIDKFGNIYVLSNDGKIVDNVHFFKPIKEYFQYNNDELNIIDVYKEKKYIVISLDRFGGRYYEYFYISFENNHLVLKSILTRSIAREDFDGKTFECKKYINVSLKKYQYHFDESTSQGFKCIKKYQIENNLSDLRKILKDGLNDKNLFEIADIDNHRIDWYLQRFPLSNKTVTQYNDIAFYLTKNQRFDTSNYLLEKIIIRFPHRAVAYLNIGDNYLKSGNNERTIYFYKKYIDLMNSQGKKSKIPSRVYEIIH